ncbi:MAG: hypothetical protein RLZZ283_703 [Candidatus Parcubacteria bacterium]|jgi:uncharacterized membrane protein
MGEKHARSVAKSVTWRLISFLNTSLVSVVVSGNPVQGLSIGIAEIVTKTVLYYLHERYWLSVKYGRTIGITADGMMAIELHTRTTLKMISWRIIGTLDTFLISYLITGSVLVSLSIGVFEFVTELVLYYIHERSWLKIKWGIKRPIRLTSTS